MYRIKSICVLFLCLLSCTHTIQPLTDYNELIDSSFISYTYDDDLGASSIYAQISLNKDMLDIVEYVWLEIDSINSDSIDFNLNDNGVDGDIVSNNGVYSLVTQVDSLINGVYNVTFHVIYHSGDITSDLLEKTVSTILDIGIYPPTINSVCMPEIYFTSEEVVDSFEVYLSLTDLNGILDIKSVVLEMKKLPGYEGNGYYDNGNCQYESIIDLDYNEVANMNMISIDSIPDSCNIALDVDYNQYIYSTGLSVNPYNGGPNCGPHGPISFRYKVTDFSNHIEYVEKDFILCWYNGVCQ